MSAARIGAGENRRPACGLREERREGDGATLVDSQLLEEGEKRNRRRYDSAAAGQGFGNGSCSPSTTSFSSSVSLVTIMASPSALVVLALVYLVLDQVMAVMWWSINLVLAILI